MKVETHKKVKVETQIDQSDNKLAELVLKGVNLLLSKCPYKMPEVSRLIEEETHVLFTLTHHEAFKI